MRFRWLSRDGSIAKFIKKPKRNQTKLLGFVEVIQLCNNTWVEPTAEAVCIVQLWRAFWKISFWPVDDGQFFLAFLRWWRTSRQKSEGCAQSHRPMCPNGKQDNCGRLRPAPLDLFRWPGFTRRLKRLVSHLYEEEQFTCNDYQVRSIDAFHPLV